MCHEAIEDVRRYSCRFSSIYTDFVILSNIDFGSNMNVGRVTRLRSAPGRNWDMMWDRTAKEHSL